MKFNILILTLLSTFLFACSNDATNTTAVETENYANLLTGRWEIQSAIRAGKATDALRGLYYEFSEPNTLTTNLINGMNETGVYTLKDNTIEQRNTQMDINYTIEKLNDSTLVLSTLLYDTNFLFTFSKAQATSELDENAVPLEE